MERADPVRVSGQAKQLRRVVDNLLANALQYTPSGGAVSVSLRGGPELVKLEVANTGVGIPSEQLPHIFKRFYRADASRSRETGASGLGLAIVAGIVAAHGGGVAGRSEPQKGSLFTVELKALTDR